MAHIQSIDNLRVNVFALPGDMLELIGAAKGCMRDWGLGTPFEWGFENTELQWRLRLPTGEITNYGVGDLVQDGRDVIPTISRMMHLAQASENMSTVTFFTPEMVTSPNGSDGAAIQTVLRLRIVDPRLDLVKEVCTAADPAACDAADPSVWSRSATVPSGSDIIWRLTATNQGNVPLNDVRVSDDLLTGASAESNQCLDATVADRLDVGASASITCVTTSVTGGNTAVNQAKLTSTFDDESPGQRLRSRFTNGVESNVSPAEILVANPALDLAKEVCSTGTSCAVDADDGWVDHAAVPLSANAEWRLTATNRGDVRLEDVAASLEELSGGMTGPSETCGALTFGSLDPGASSSAVCETASIEDTTQDTVNTATVKALPVDGEGTPLALLPDGIESSRASASVEVDADPTSGFRPPGPFDPPVPNDPGSPGDPSVPAATGSSSIPAAIWRESLAATGLDNGALVPFAVVLVLAGVGALGARLRRGWAFRSPSGSPAPSEPRGLVRSPRRRSGR